MMARILVVDDEKNLRELLAMALEGAGHAVQGAGDGIGARKALASGSWDLLITDLKLPDVSGLDILREAKGRTPELPVILITAFASTETAVTAMKEGAFDYLEKPFPMEDLHLVVARALEQVDLKRENTRLKVALEESRPKRGVIGNSPAMRRILELAGRVGRTSATVLVTGESGTGKELIARYVHDHSSRSKGPFIAINCAAIPETLIESELFGHTKGAFSGATQSRKGVFVEADGGTLLLDEIGEMPLSTQVKLLRVLQERAVRPVGTSGAEKPVDARLVCTTNRDLGKEVSEGRFREDLYYRINVVNLHLPPLRERQPDIPLLVNRFVEKFAKRYELPVRRVEPAAADCLARYSFPGNVRELENVIEGAISLTTGDTLDILTLPHHIREPQQVGRSSEEDLGEFELPESGVDLEGLLSDIEAKTIRQALERAGGNKTKAAELLGLSFRSFRYRISKLGVE
ncbi:MAG: sigma-54-dependent Fis family transcriptional regulator [Magnetococcales bacterium]|nr:sigma-54-dependent Fis family transcriptional regulator [Magnetococcales bacterium]